MAHGHSSDRFPSRLRRALSHRALSHRVLAPVLLAATVTAGWVYAVAPPLIEAQEPAPAPATRVPDSPPEPPASVTTITELPPVALVPSAPVVVGTATSGSVDVTPALAALLLEAYRNAVAGSPEACHLPVSLLAAIGEVESGSLAGRVVDAEHRSHVLGPVLDGDPFARVPDTDGGLLDGNRRWDRALGPMQILPGTWVRFATDGDHDGRLDPQDLDDATATAASYLCAGGRDLSRPEDLRAAVLAYNHSTAYLRLVMTLMVRYQAAGLDQTLPTDVMVATAALQLSATSLPTGGNRVRGYVETGFGAPSGSPSVVVGSAAPTPAEQVVAALGGPTVSPAVTPSAGSSPTADATTAGPTASPTVSPEPTVSPDPTGTPSPVPSPTGGATDGPSGNPTDTPTDTPSSSPSSSPSSTATGTASGDPSTGPSSSPDPSPSPTCSTEPAADPTDPTATDPTATPAPCPDSTSPSPAPASPAG